MDKDLIEDKQYQLIDKLNRRKINHRDIYFVLLHNIIYLSNTSIYIICQQFQLEYYIFRKTKSIANRSIYVYFHQFCTLKYKFT